MDANKLPHDEIERFVLGQMDRAESISFEKTMEQNDVLKSEVALQKNIISGIGYARKAALKSRLAEVPVSSSWLSYAFNSGWSKVALGVVVVSTASVVSYLQLPQSTRIQRFEPLTVTAPAPEEPLTLTIPQRSTVQPIAEALKDVENTKSIADELAEENTAVDVLPVVTIPALPDPNEALVFAEEEEVADSQPVISPAKAPIQLSVINSENERLYRYFDGELVLKGDYNSVEYDLIELNSPEDKRYFIEIERTYYAMPPSAEFRKLQLIKDQALISRLDSLSTYR